MMRTTMSTPPLSQRLDQVLEQSGITGGIIVVYRGDGDEPGDINHYSFARSKDTCDLAVISAMMHSLGKMLENPTFRPKE